MLAGILDLLKPEDSFFITLFSDAACTPKQFGPTSCVDIPSLKASVGGAASCGAMALPGALPCLAVPSPHAQQRCRVSRRSRDSLALQPPF